MMKRSGNKAIAQMPDWVPELVSSEIVPECGHWIQQEKPEETNAFVLEFLKGLNQ